MASRYPLPRSTNDIPVETAAIVNATYADVNSQHSAIMLRMWHHLLPHADRDALFANFGTGSGQSLTLLQAFLAGIRARTRTGWPVLRPPPGLGKAHLPALEHAFGDALSDVLGPLAAPMVVNAWREMLRAFLHEICCRECG